ncbi:MAG: hypothetical protein LBC02_10215 [Planctomycetaceae bacterium]|jgi:hypothetical protein|nr:hypothetical protein [Planctomycetaceae bacterium]
MSYFQPLITSAFSNYSISRNVYADRVSAQNLSVENRKTESSQNTVKVDDPDAGKPKSASGDILDLSLDVQKQYETKTNDKKAEKIEVNNNESEKDNENEIKSSDDSLETAEKTSTKNDLSGTELTPEEQQQVQELKARDQEVRVHEAAHVAAGGPYVTSGPSYTYQTGPDGKSYAIGGEVGIDTSEVSGDPQATIQKMQTVVAAALAPAEPSSQDQKVAAAARQKEAQARAELAQQNHSAVNGNQENKNSTSSPLAIESESESSPSATSTNQSDSDKSGKSSDKSNESGKTVTDSGSFSATKSFVAGLTKSTQQSSAYQAQSSMPLSSTFSNRFSAFA